MAKVFVGLSGGVDSAVSAALLKEKGFDVAGVFIKIWQPEFMECTWSADRVDAMRVAVALGIPFLEADFSDDYKTQVAGQMIAGYSQGITPNPDVLCNRSIKFGSFLKYAEKEGADFIATGHYVRKSEIRNPKSETNRKSQNVSFELLRGKDKDKDQSYFLYTLWQYNLARALFPIGGLLKSEVRDIAVRFALPVATKPDSQGLCFIGDVTMKDFLSRFIKLRKGAVLDGNGVIIGTHDGAELYTVGQRHGFSITRRAHGSILHYVISTNIKDNTISVSENIKDAARKYAVVDNIHWIGNEPEMPFEAEIQARYREIPIRAIVKKDGGRVTALFSSPRIVSLGQSLVLYHGDECLGGGIITG